MFSVYNKNKELVAINIYTVYINQLTNPKRCCIQSGLVSKRLSLHSECSRKAEITLERFFLYCFSCLCLFNPSKTSIYRHYNIRQYYGSGHSLLGH